MSSVVIPNLSPLSAFASEPATVLAQAAAAVARVDDVVGSAAVAHAILLDVLCAALAAIFTITWLHPVDVVKTRLQLSKVGDPDSSYRSLLRSMIGKNEGYDRFYRGLTAAWTAEAVYYGLQLGLYEPLKRSLGGSGEGSSLRVKILAGACAGSFGAVTGNPWVILRTRMIVHQGASSRGLTSFVRDVLRDEGSAGFYRGFTAMFVRAIVLSATKMATYDTVKTFVRETFPLLEGIALQFLAALVAGSLLTLTVMPFDIIRTTMMTPDRAEEYKDGTRKLSFVKCGKRIYQQYGLGGYYRGATAFWVRIAPKTCLQFVAFEYLKSRIHGNIS